MKKNRTPYMVIKRVYERLEQKFPRNCTEVIKLKKYIRWFIKRALEKMTNNLT